MKLKILPAIIFLISTFTATSVFASENSSGKILLKGKVTDKETNEELIGAVVYVKELKIGTATDVKGEFRLKIPAGNYTFEISFIGYKTLTSKILVKPDMYQVFKLTVEPKTIDDVIVKAERSDENITRSTMSVEKLKIKQIKQIPALMGEVDIIKAIQLLPGVQATSEGGSGFSVRGGNYDQNLILLDDAPVYNASHLMGFFSVFNNDAVKDISLYKGDIPAAYGGRLSSVLKVKIDGGNTDKIHAKGGIGTISSRLTIEGPLFNDKTSFLLAGRRSYADIFIPLFAKNKPELEGVGLYFYDLNGKIKHRIDNKNIIQLNGYTGWDKFYQKSAEFGFGNTAATLSWIHSYNENAVSKISAIYTKYNYKTSATMSDEKGFLWTSKIQDYGIKVDNTVLINKKNKLKFGLSSVYHKFNPGVITPIGSEQMFSEFKLEQNSSIESGIYASNIHNITDKLTLKYGLRLSLFQNIGPGTSYNYNENHELIDTIGTYYGKGKIFNTYFGFEPRIGLVYKFDSISSIKASYSRTNQYVQIASNSAGGFPLDIWFSANKNVKPQVADQIAVGYFRNFYFNKIEASVEGYYKKMNSTIDFKDHAELLFNKYLEGEFRIGESWSYGAEFMVRFNFEKLNGWVSYTLSKTKRKIAEINKGNVYNAPYDKPNDVSIVLNYLLNSRISFSATWVYATGAPLTVPSGRFVIDNTVLSVYSDRNAYRMPDYHRLDLSVNIKTKLRGKRKWYGEWNFSVYNAYARHNAWVINFVQDENNPNKTNAEMTYLFSIIPSITYNFKF
jgi:hypothetical protein